MARKSRHSFQRRERDLAKAAKREAKREARAAAKLAKQEGSPQAANGDVPDDESAGESLEGATMERRLAAEDAPGSDDGSD